MRCPGWYPDKLVARAMEKRRQTIARARQEQPPWAVARAMAPNPQGLAVRPTLQPSVSPLTPAQVPRTSVIGKQVAPVPPAVVQQSVVRPPYSPQAVAPLPMPVAPNLAGTASLNSGLSPSPRARTSREADLHLSPLNPDTANPNFNTKPFTSPPSQ